MKRTLLIFILILCTLTLAAKAPKHRSLRAESMGSAHVAVVDDKEAIYYNYAGLNQINRLGNYEIRPEQGYYPRNIFDMRLNLGGAGPFETYFDTYKFARDLQRLYRRVDKAAAATGKDAMTLLLDTLAMHPDIVDDMNSFDRANLAMEIKFDAELAMHNFGGAIWVDGSVSPFVDGGLVIPFLGVDTFYIDAVAQMGFAYGFGEKFSAGMGIKIAKREKVEYMEFGLSNYETITDTLNDRVSDALDDMFDFETIAFGLDFGLLYQLTREIRLGASLRDVYFKELAGDKITPDLTVGFNYSPRYLNRNIGFGRKFNFAVDYADAFNDDRNYKPLSHVNFGVEFEQTILAWPGYSYFLRALSLRIASGFKGGYFTAGASVEVAGLITVEFATWAEEEGYYTGQDEQRVYMGQISLGF